MRSWLQEFEEWTAPIITESSRLGESLRIDPLLKRWTFAGSAELVYRACPVSGLDVDAGDLEASPAALAVRDSDRPVVSIDDFRDDQETLTSSPR